MYLIILLALFGTGDIDSVTVSGFYDGCLFVTATEAYYYLEVKDSLRLIVVIEIPVKRTPKDSTERWYLIIKGYHQYRLVNGIWRLVIIADQYKWFGHGRFNK